MAVTINSSPGTPPVPESNTKLEASVASLAKSNQELEGQMALQLLNTAGSTANVPAPTATSGTHVNIKV